MDQIETIHMRSFFTLPLVATFLLLAATLAASKLTSNHTSEFLARPLDTIDRQILGYTGTDNPPITENVLKELKPSSYLVRTYSKGDLKADLFIAFYAQQRAGESMHSPKHCLPGSGWEIWNYQSANIPANGQTFTVNEYSISHEGERRLVLYWYQSRNRVIASEYLGKILLARDTLMQSSTAASIVRIIVPDRPGTAEQARALGSALIPMVQRCFGDDKTLD
jgi:EpsI family protein